MGKYDDFTCKDWDFYTQYAWSSVQGWKWLNIAGIDGNSSDTNKVIGDDWDFSYKSRNKNGDSIRQIITKGKHGDVACKNGNMNQQASVDADGWWCWPMAHHQKGWVWLGRSFVLRLDAENLSGEQEHSRLFSKIWRAKGTLEPSFLMNMFKPNHWHPHAIFSADKWPISSWNPGAFVVLLYVFSF